MDAEGEIQGLVSHDAINFESEWNNISASIDVFLAEHEKKPDEGKQPKIVKTHWVPDKDRKHCSNSNCAVNFSFTIRKHHCRRCGEVFCFKCVAFSQRLSVLAQQDANGYLYKVCIKCYSEDSQLPGHTCSRMTEFKDYKKKNVKSEDSLVCEDMTSTVLERLKSLTNKYEEYINGSKLNLVELMKSSITVPLWQIPQGGLSNSRYCKLCTRKFYIFRFVHHCRVCGEVVCLECSSEDLLLYCDQFSKIANWAILGIVGCPLEVPLIRECLRLCTSCHSHATHIQIENHLRETRNKEMDCLTSILEYHDGLQSLKVEIDSVLQKYMQVVFAIYEERDLCGILGKDRSTTKVLAKYNSDTSDLFTQFAIDMQSFKRVKPKTTCQLRLVSSITNAMYSYYSKQFYNFRDLQRSLDDTLGCRVLESVQYIVDYQTINCTVLALKQLGLECLEICEKYKLNREIASFIATCEEVAKQDLKKCVESSGENWKQHEEHAHMCVKICLKEKSLLVSSLRNIQPDLVLNLMLKKSDLILLKIERQLRAKARVNKFLLTKESLEITRRNIAELKTT